MELYQEYAAVKEHFDLKAWTEWPDRAIRRRQPESLASYRERIDVRLELPPITQYLFFKQWLELKEIYLMTIIEIVGDMPIYVAADSADVWAPTSLLQDR